MKIANSKNVWRLPRLWDCWFYIDENEVVHKFQLAAPRIISSVQRHHAAAVHHSTSKDLIHWSEGEIVLLPESTDDPWDNVAIWTGSVINRDGKVLMYYTSRNYRKFWQQKIGVAIAKDDTLRHWEKHREPVLVADEQIYTMPDKLYNIGSPKGFRDPFAFRNPQDGKYYIAFTGNEKEKGLYGGCVGLALADDPLQPQLLAPICSPGNYWEMEVPQIVFHKGLVYLFFSCGITRYRPSWSNDHPEVRQAGLHCYVSDNLFGGFEPVNGNAIVLDLGKEQYAHSLVKQGGEVVTMIGFVSNEATGPLHGGPTLQLQLRLQGTSVTVV